MLLNPVSKKSVISISLGLLALGALAAITIPLVPRAVQADERNGKLHVLKECPTYTGAAGQFCTITSSNLEELVGAMVFYDQAAVGLSGTPEGGYVFLDSNVVLYAGTGNWAVGRCTLDPTYHGLCTFSDGTGKFTGFHARVAVAPAGGVDFSWDGTYSFRPEPGS